MPKEEKTKVEGNGKLVNEIYIDSEVMDKFWIEGSKSYYGKTDKGMLGTLIFNECCNERVILLMGSHCGPDDLMEEEESFSEESNGISYEDVSRTESMGLTEKLTAGDFDAKLFGGKDHEENKISEVESKESEVSNSMATSAIAESKSQEDCKIHDLETENLISFGKEVQESVDGIQQYSGSLPYSGSISLRSTSSTTSTQSFAFPILAQERNSSPVRMVKADKRQLGKQKCWKMKIGCGCCRF